MLYAFLLNRTVQQQSSADHFLSDYFKRANFVDLYPGLSQVLWRSLNELNEVNLVFKNFYEPVYQILDSNVRHKQSATYD